MFLRWMWLKKQAAIPYCVSRSCHLFLLRKRETVWLATRNTDRTFNRGSLFVSGLFTAAKMKMFTYTDNLFHCSCEARFCLRSRLRRSFCFEQKHRKRWPSHWSQCRLAPHRRPCGSGPLQMKLCFCAVRGHWPSVSLRRGLAQDSGQEYGFLLIVL